MLAVVAAGGVAAPLVHEALHAAERDAALADHAADGYHTRGDRPVASETCPTPGAPLDLDCALCHGLTAALVAAQTSAPADVRATGFAAARASAHAAQPDAAHAGRGPPVA